MTVYAYPEELNYPTIRKDKNWFNLEVFNINNRQDSRKEKLSQSERLREKFKSLEKFVPKKFLYDNDQELVDNQKKFIYVSLGSMGSMDLELMNRLLGTLAKSPSAHYKFIVSKGPRHEELEWIFVNKNNFWGAEFLPQAQMLQFVDLVITHGGNNTVTEVFAEGKPMIVMPMFSDQFDNGQRLKETGLGVCLDPYHFTETELFDAIEHLLSDEKLTMKLEQASKRIHSMKHHQKLADKIEEMFC